MSTTIHSLIQINVGALIHLVRSGILLCGLMLSACAGIPMPQAQSDMMSMSYHASDLVFETPVRQRPDRIWWTLHAW
jgi:hypothetical protein